MEGQRITQERKEKPDGATNAWWFFFFYASLLGFPFGIRGMLFVPKREEGCASSHRQPYSCLLLRKSVGEESRKCSCQSITCNILFLLGIRIFSYVFF